MSVSHGCVDIGAPAFSLGLYNRMAPVRNLGLFQMFSLHFLLNPAQLPIQRPRIGICHSADVICDHQEA